MKLLSQRGMSLSEVMISLFLSSFIIIAGTHHYLSCKRQTHFIQTSLNQTQDVLMVIDLMRHSIHHAGFTPCLNLNHWQLLDKHHQIIQAIQIDEKKPSSLWINRMDERFDVVKTMLNPYQLLTNNTSLKVNDEVFIGNCSHMEINQISAISSLGKSQKITLTKPMGDSFESDVYIGKWFKERFYIEKNTFYYQAGHAEQLTNAIKGMLISDQQGQLIKVNLSLNDGNTIYFETALPP